MSRWRTALYRAGLACLTTAAITVSTVAGTCEPLGEAPALAPEQIVIQRPAASGTAAPASAAPSASPASPAPESPAPSPSSPVAVAAGDATAPAVAISMPAKSPAPAIHYADLSHLTYTATGLLQAAFVAPANGSVQTTGAARVTVATGAGGGVELLVNGAVVPASNIGSRSVDPQSGATRYEFFGVKLQPGPNTVVAVPLGAEGARGTPVQTMVFGPGKPVRLSAHVDGALVADGKTPALLRIAAFDAWGHPALPGSVVHVALVSGDATLGTRAADAKDVAPLAAAPPRAGELALQPGGVAELPIVPGLVANPVLLRVVTGDASEDVSVTVRPALRHMFVTGLASVGVGSVPGTHDGADLEDGGGSRRGRVALFGTGAVGQSGVAFAYESANRLTPSSVTGPFVDDREEAPYQNAGDTSLQRDDVRSRDHLYLRVDAPRSTFTWGEFQAQTGPADGLGGYAQMLSGAQLQIRSPKQAPALTLFTAKNDVAYARRVFRVTGLATMDGPLDPDIVVGSETVTLASVDRRTGAVVLQTPLTRDVDYVLDYATGALRFLTLPLPFDSQFNPQAIVVQYQYAGSRVRSQTTGGRAELKLGNAARVGVGYVNDATGTGNYSLFQQDVAGGGPGWHWSLAHAASRGNVGDTGGSPGTDPVQGNGGDALRGSLAVARGALRFSAEYDSTTAGFANPFGGLSTPGLQNYRVALSRVIPERSELTLEVDGQRNRGTSADDAQQSAALHLRRTVSNRFSFGAGIESRTHEGAVTTAPGGAAVQTAPGTTVQAQLSGDYKLGKRAAVSVSRVSTIGGTEDLSQPSQTSAQFSLDLPHAGKAYVRELWSAAPTLSFANATAGLTASAQATRSLMVGVQQPLSANTTVDSDYVVDRSTSGTTAYGVMGLRERLELSSRLRAEAFMQQATGGGGAFAVGGVQLGYANAGGLHASASLQTRGGESAGTTAELRATGALSSEVTLLADLQFARSTVVSTGDASIGIAVRPTQNDRHVTLLSLDRKLGTLETGTDRSDVVSLDHLFRPDDRTDLSLRFAYKIDGDGYYAARSTLLDFRAVRKLTTRFDVGAETRTVSAANIAGSRSTAFAAEAGYRLNEAMRVAVGHSFSASADPSLTGTPVRRGFYLTVTSVLDRLFRDTKR
jgi:hypothetical protein